MEPIIKSLLTNDTYKPYMSRYAFTKPEAYYGRNVRYRLYNRTKSVRLADHVPLALLAPELDHIRDLTFQPKEIGFIGTIHPVLGEPAYKEALSRVRLPDYHLGVTDDGQLDLTVTGKWGDGIWWEVPTLALVNQMFTTSVLNDPNVDRSLCYARGVSRMHNKIALLRQHPDIKFLWFGTRRAASRDWERMCFETWLEAIPAQIIGCSNLQFAMDYGVKAAGTQAHEAQQIIAAILGMISDEMLFASTGIFADEWWQLFGGTVSIFLSDTFGSNHFFRTFGEDRAQRWWGARQDSGDPFWWGEKYIEMLRSFGVNPVGKMGLFSDGEDPWLMVRLNEHFKGRMSIGHGPGTNLSNDIGVPNLSLVMKVDAVEDDDGNWVSTVKLSDNPAKAIGSPEEIERYKRVFDYVPGETVQPRY